MSMRYKGGVISATPPEVGIFTGASGIWSLESQLQYRATGEWPDGSIPDGLYGWGRNNYRQIGTVGTFSSPVQVGSSTTEWADVSGGYDQSMGIKTTGTLWTWGRNQHGQLGQGDTTTRLSPSQVGALTTWAKSSMGMTQAAAVKTNGTLWTWGYNDYGQLGQGNVTSLSSPVQVGALTTWLDVACGYYATMAIKTDGTIWGFGYNYYGNLGQRDTTNRSSPVQVVGFTDWSCIASGRDHVLAVRSNGQLWAWGANGQGQLGQGNTTNYSSPVQVGTLTNWSTTAPQLAGGRYTSFGVKTDGSLYAWGYNSLGQIGQPPTGANYSSPVQVGSLTTWSKVAGGREYVRAIKTDGTLWAWGGNSNGQLGLGDTANRSSPVQVGTRTSWTVVGKNPSAFSSLGIQGS